MGIVYNWYQASGTYNETYNPTAENVCASLALGSHSDWRLPTKQELLSITNYGIPAPGPMIKTTYFPNTKQAWYWSSNTNARDSDLAMYVDFNNGDVGDYYKDYIDYVRCVRGGQTVSPTFADNGNGTVTDNVTGLMWQQGEAGTMTWDSALSYCEGLSLGDKSDWRLPNIKEFESITDDTRYNPAIDTTFFPNVMSSNYWSSTTDADDPDYAWYIPFYYGFVYDSDGFKSNSYYVRCVRAGQRDVTPPEVNNITPQANQALQDGVLFQAQASDLSGIYTVSFSVREPDGGEGIPIGYDDLEATYNSTSGYWEYSFDTTQLQDGYYVIFAKATDNAGNEGMSSVVPFSIRNWAVITTAIHAEQQSRSHHAG